jgi:Tfp pilus assembly protein PilO
MAFFILLCIAVFWAFIYSPARTKVVRLKGELAAIQSEIDKIERVSGGEKNLDKAYEKLYKQFTDLEEKLVKEAGAVLSALSSEADRMNIEVLVIKPEKVKPSKLPVKVQGRSVIEMPISINLRCDYITFGEYINVLSEKLNAVVNVDRLNMSHSREEDGSLDIWLNIILYMLK